MELVLLVVTHAAGPQIGMVPIGKYCLTDSQWRLSQAVRVWRTTEAAVQLTASGSSSDG